MKKRKTLLMIALLAITLLLLTTACGGGGDKDSKSSSSSVQWSHPDPTPTLDWGNCSAEQAAILAGEGKDVWKECGGWEPPSR